jgi:subtilisin family serine protease
MKALARHRRSTVAFLVSAGLLASLAGTAGADGPPIGPPGGPPAARIPPAAVADHYIVVMAPGAPAASRGLAVAATAAAGGEVSFEYGAALNGFAATLPAPAVEALRRNPNVVLVEPDHHIQLEETQSPAPWGLDRIDQRQRPLNGSYAYDSDGSGVTVYVVDTGIRLSHAEFGGRATSGYDAVDGGRADDCHGHGTHVAGTVGGSNAGVAKNVQLVAVRVLDCLGRGTVSGVIAGIDWVTAHHGAGQPAVANLSLGGAASAALDTAVANSITDGVTYTVAAGNVALNACLFSPARVGPALTVGATTSTDARAPFSNYGSCLDLFAPGSSIPSAWSTSDTATRTASGTSMAAPHVAGVAARLLQGSPQLSPVAVADAILAAATPGVVSGAGSGSPNRLLHLAAASTAPPPTEPPGGEPPPTEPAPAVCPALPESYSGSLSRSGDADVVPGDRYFIARAGTHRGCLDGPDGADFDLLLLRWSGRSWVIAARATSPSPDEELVYDGSAGYYRWRLQSVRGAGSYTFVMQRP